MTSERAPTSGEALRTRVRAFLCVQEVEQEPHLKEQTSNNDPGSALTLGMTPWVLTIFSTSQIPPSPKTKAGPK